MAYYRTCLDCGAELDPGEKCNCQEEAERARKRLGELYKQETKSNQFVFNWGTEGVNTCIR